MGVNREQLTNNETTRDDVIQLLKILKQRNLGNKIDEEEASKLINGIINASKDDVVELHRSKRGVPFVALYGLAVLLGRTLLHKKGPEWGLKLFQRYSSTPHGKRKMMELSRGALDDVDLLGDFVDWLRQSGLLGTDEEQVTEMPQVAEGQSGISMRGMLEVLGFPPEVVAKLSERLDDLSGTGEERVAERQNVTTTVSPVVKAQNVTTAMPAIAKGQNVTTAIDFFQNWKREKNSIKSYI